VEDSSLSPESKFIYRAIILDQIDQIGQMFLRVRLISITS
jgi:hypothetical protein